MSIPENRFREIKLARETCLFATDIEEKCALLLENYYDFECELLKLAQAQAIWPERRSKHADSMLDRLALDRRLVNLLTACRLYSDQTDHAISTSFGEKSSELAECRKFKNDLYDANWGFRFMEALRNHLQHSGLVVHVITSSLSRVEKNIQFTVAPETVPDILANNPRFKKAILEEITDLKKPIDLRRPLREYVSCFVRLHEKIRQIMDLRFQQDRNLYEAAVKEFTVIDNKTVTYAYLQELNDDETISQEYGLFTGFLDYHDLLRNKYSASPRFETVCASNII